MCDTSCLQLAITSKQQSSASCAACRWRASNLHNMGLPTWFSTTARACILLLLEYNAAANQPYYAAMQQTLSGRRRHTQAVRFMLLPPLPWPAVFDHVAAGQQQRQQHYSRHQSPAKKARSPASCRVNNCRSSSRSPNRRPRSAAAAAGALPRRRHATAAKSTEHITAQRSGASLQQPPDSNTTTKFSSSNTCSSKVGTPLPLAKQAAAPRHVAPLAPAQQGTAHCIDTHRALQQL
jgi:hypothetical protein